MLLFIKDIDDLKKHVLVESGFKLTTIEPFIAKAQETILVKRFGRTFIDTLIARHHDAAPSPALTSLEQSLIFHLQAIEAHFAVQIGLPHLIASLTNGGFSQTKTPQREGIFKWQSIAIENAHLEEAYSSIENAFMILWENRNHAQFADWKNSTYEARSVDTLIHSADTFNQSYQRITRRTFEAMLSSIKDAERRLVSVIGSVTYNTLVSQTKGFNPSPATTALLPYVQDAITRLSVSIAIPRLPFHLSEDGIMMVSITATPDALKNQSNASEDRLTALGIDAISGYSEKVADLRTFLAANLATYTDYAASPEYAASIAVIETNTTENKSIIL